MSDLKKIIFVVGLPASGKTHHLNLINSESTLIADDFISKEIVESMYHSLCTSNYNTLILSDSFFCKESIINNCIKFLKEDLHFTGDIQLIYFENNKEQCLLNAQRRSNKKVDEFIRYLSGIYNPPKECLKVWKENLNEKENI